MEQRYWIQWLPSQVAAVAKAEEPNRFAALAATVNQLVTTAAADASPGAWHGVTSYLPLLNNLLQTRQVFSPEHVVPLVHSLLQVVCSASHDLEVQVRTAECVANLLQHHKKILSKPLRYETSPGAEQEAEGMEPPKLVLAWRPLFDLMMSLYGDPPPSIEGVGLAKTRLDMLKLLVTRCRRYFEPAAAQELWQLLRPGAAAVADAVTDAYEAVGWLSLFAPTNMINRIGSAAANQLLAEWMSAWSRLACSPTWDTLWSSLLARLAKHDWKGCLDWRSYLPQLFTQLMASVDIPVGTANLGPVMQRPTPSRSMLLFSNGGSSTTANLARLMVHLLRSTPQQPDTQQHAADVAAHLQQVAALLDNYMHPSNTGRWSGTLSVWLSKAVDEFMHQLGKQGAAPPPWVASIDNSTQEAFVGLCAALAARGQFSKNANLSTACVTALADLAYVRPAAVLPLVVSRFRTALESATATHQLNAAIRCLARCVRPMLLAGWGLEDAAGPELLAEALVALLPGIDANDEDKTLAVIHLYTAVLSSAPGMGSEGELPEDLPAKAVRIPVYMEEWADDVLGRILSLLSNLDTGPGHRADAAAGRHSEGSSSQAGASTFLVDDKSLFKHMVELLLSRTPKDVSRSLAARIAKWSSSEVLPGVERAAWVLLHEATRCHPDVVVREFMQPVLSKLLLELRSENGSDVMHEISHTQEGVVTYQLSLAGTVIAMLPFEHVQQLLPQIKDVVDTSLQVASRPVQNAGEELLEELCAACLRWTDDCKSRAPQLAPLGPDGALLLEWIDREGNGADTPTWIAPSEAAVQTVTQLMDTYLMQPTSQLASMLGVATPSTAATAPLAPTVDQTSHVGRLQIHAELMKIKAVLGGLGSNLADFNVTSPPTDTSPKGVPVYVAGLDAPRIGQPSVREQLAPQLAAIGAVLNKQHDAEALPEFIVIADMLLCVGSMEFTDSRSSKRRDKLLHEPAAAGLLVTANNASRGAGAPDRPWRKRVTILEAKDRTHDMLKWRTSQRVFRWWATDTMPQVTQLRQLSPSYLALLQSVLSMVTHPLRPVRVEALTTLAPVLVRFPFLSHHILPHLFSVLADVQLPASFDLTHQLQHEQAGTWGANLNTLMSGLKPLLLAAAYRGLQPPPHMAILAGLPSEDSDHGMNQGERDARVDGAVHALQHNLAFFRVIFRYPDWHECLMYSCMASRAHNSSVAQASLSSLFVNVLSRYLRPPTLQYSDASFTQLATHMLHLAHPDTLRSNWRYALAANVLVLLLQPLPETGAACLPFARHFMHSLLQPGCSLQLGQLALSGLSLAFTRMLDYGEDNAQLVAEVKSWLSQPSTGSTLAALLATDHTTLDAAEGGRDNRRSGMAALAALLNSTHEEMMLRVAMATYERLTRWPEGGTSAWLPEAISQGLFVVTHAQLVHQLAVLAPEPAMALFRPLLDKAVSAPIPTTTSDKAEQATAAEITAGLLAAGLGGSDRNASLLQLTARQLQGCTLELSEAWAVTLRYAIHGLMDVAHPPLNLYQQLGSRKQPAWADAAKANALQNLASILQLARSAGPPPSQLGSTQSSTSGTADVLKRMRYSHQCARELLCYRLDDSLPQSVLKYWVALTNDLRDVLGVDVLSMRQQLGKTIGLLLMHVASHCQLDAPATAGTGSSEAANVQAVQAAAQALQAQLLQAFADGAATVQALKEQGAAPPPGKSNGGGSGSGSEGNGSGSEGGASLLSDVVMVERPPSPVPLPDDEPTAPVPMSAAGGASEPPQNDIAVALSHVGLGLGVLAWSSFHGDLNIMLRPLLLPMLPQVLRLQELAGPILQKLSQDSQTAFTLAKYWPPPSDAASLELVLHTLEDAATPSTSGTLDRWSTRAAAVAYAQYWWFRTCFLLPHPLATRLQQLVLNRLADSKPEVRSMAGATLSGMLRGATRTDVEQLRQHYVASARQLLVPVRLRGTAGTARPAADATGMLLEKHAVVQALMAFLQSSPYDCPPWTPQVLMALVRPAAAQHGSGIDAALRSAASKALSDFKRTHEQDSMAALRAMMSEDEWDSLQQATSSSSYFT